MKTRVAIEIRRGIIDDNDIAARGDGHSGNGRRRIYNKAGPEHQHEIGFLRLVDGAVNGRFGKIFPEEHNLGFQDGLACRAARQGTGTNDRSNLGKPGSIAATSAIME